MGPNLSKRLPLFCGKFYLPGSVTPYMATSLPTKKNHIFTYRKCTSHVFYINQTSTSRVGTLKF